VDDGKGQIILAVLATPAEVVDSQPALDLLRRGHCQVKLPVTDFRGECVGLWALAPASPIREPWPPARFRFSSVSLTMQ
jgi:hypothetical protein